MSEDRTAQARQMAEQMYEVLTRTPVKDEDVSLRAEWAGIILAALTSASAAKDEEIAKLRRLLERARPKHYAGECGHCGMDELPPASCAELQFIAEIDAALSESR